MLRLRFDQLLEHGDAVLPREEEVEDDQLVAAAPGHLERAHAVRRLIDLETLVHQRRETKSTIRGSSSTTSTWGGMHRHRRRGPTLRATGMTELSYARGGDVTDR